MAVDGRLPPLTHRRFSYAGSIFNDAGMAEKFAWLLEMRRSSEQQRRARASSGAETDDAVGYVRLVPSPRAPELRPIPPAPATRLRVR
jgi:hypothetical protein